MIVMSMRSFLVIELIFMLGLCGCKEASKVSESIVVDGGTYTFELVVENELNSAKEFDLKYDGGFNNMLVSRLFVQEERVVTLSPTPTQSDAVRFTGGHLGIGTGWETVKELFFDGDKLYLGTPYDSSTRIDEMAVIDLEGYQDVYVSGQKPMTYLTVAQGVSYPKFLEIFEIVANCSSVVGLGYYSHVNP